MNHVMQVAPVGAMNMEVQPIGNTEIEDVQDDEAEASKKNMYMPPWTRQITLRGVIASFVIGSMYCMIVMKLTLTTGIIPNLNVSAALLAFLLLRSWTKLLDKAGILTVPFTRQENTMIQTCVVACYSIAIGGGFGSTLLALSKKTYEQAGIDTPGNSPGSYKDLKIAWIIGFLSVISLIGIFVLIPLRKFLIIDYKLPFPTGTATAVLINGFHNQGENMARKQVRGFIKYFSLSFLWAFFQWFYTGKGGCGFSQFPTFGLQAWKHTFNFDFSATYVGTGMICPLIVNLSTLLGAVLSWAVLWPLLGRLKGDWFPSNLPESSMKSLDGYKVFLSIALLLGDGLYHFIKVLCITFLNINAKRKQRNLDLSMGARNKTLEDQNQDEVFVRGSIPTWVAAGGYMAFAVIAVTAVPAMFPEIKWYYVIVAYVAAPSLAFCNAYAIGLTDMNMSYNYSKIGLFALAALAGERHGVVAGLAGCGLLKSVIAVSSTLIQDMKTGHLTLTSPRAMLLGQAAGTAIGCVVAPLSFFLFYRAFDIGNPEGEYKAPFAIVYRNMAILGVEGFSALPQHCLQLCGGFFGFAVGVNVVKDLVPAKVGKWLPLPSAMSVPFLIGGNFAIDMCVGSLVVLGWKKVKGGEKAELMVPIVASGLICGEGLWTLPASLLSLAKISPPICMKFLDS